MTGIEMPRSVAWVTYLLWLAIGVTLINTVVLLSRYVVDGELGMALITVVVLGMIPIGILFLILRSARSGGRWSTLLVTFHSALQFVALIFYFSFLNVVFALPAAVSIVLIWLPSAREYVRVSAGKRAHEKLSAGIKTGDWVR